MKKYFLQQIIIITLISLTLISCEQKGQRYAYQEKIKEAKVSAPMISMQNHPQADLIAETAVKPTLQWTLPEAWVEKPASGLRIGSFTDQSQSIDVSIISLGGQAGGIKANLTRWMGQINLTIDDQRFDQFLANATKINNPLGWSGQLFDFSVLQTDVAKEAPSMVVTLFFTNDQTIFVKMTGTKESIKAQINAFKQLCESIHN